MNRSFTVYSVIFGLIGIIAIGIALAADGIVNRPVVEAEAVENTSNLCIEDTYVVFGLCSSTNRPQLLVLTKASVFAHPSIPAGKTMLSQLANTHNYDLTFTVDSSIFMQESATTYDAVIFLNTDSIVFENDAEKQAFRNYIESGKGYVGIHGAAATHWNKDKWNWYRDMVGQRFVNHPPGRQFATMDRIDKNHPSTAHLPDRWRIKDEWYNWEGQVSSNVNVLLTVDESSYSGGTMGSFHPIAWNHTFGPGESRVWYTNLGHEIDLYTNLDYIKHVEGGISWVLNGD